MCDIDFITVTFIWALQDTLEVCFGYVARSSHIKNSLANNTNNNTYGMQTKVWSSGGNPFLAWSQNRWDLSNNRPRQLGSVSTSTWHALGVAKPTFYKVT